MLNTLVIMFKSLASVLADHFRTQLVRQWGHDPTGTIQLCAAAQRRGPSTAGCRQSLPDDLSRESVSDEYPSVDITH